MNRIAIEVVAVLGLLLGFAAWERHRGAQNCLNTNQTIIANQVSQAAVTTAVDRTHIEAEASTYADTLRQPVLLINFPRVVCLREPAPAAVPGDRPAGPERDAGHRLPTPPGEPLQLGAGEAGDIAAPAITVGRDANAQVKALKDYIHSVCLQP